MIYSIAGIILSADRHSRLIVRSYFKRYERKHLINLSEGVKLALIKGISSFPLVRVHITLGESDFKFIKHRCNRWATSNSYISLQEIVGANHLHLKDFPQDFEKSLKILLKSLNEDIKSQYYFQ